MAGKIRTIKPDFFASADATAVSRDARLLWIGLWVFGDDAGRIKASVREIKNRVFPGDDDLGLPDVAALLDELVRAGRLVAYEADGDRFVVTPNFRKHQRIDKRFESVRYPAPPDHAVDTSSARSDHHVDTTGTPREHDESTTGPPREHDEDSPSTPREHVEAPVCPPRALSVSTRESVRGSSTPIQILSPEVHARRGAHARAREGEHAETARWASWLSWRDEHSLTIDAPINRQHLETAWRATEGKLAAKLADAPAVAFERLCRAYLAWPEGSPLPGGRTPVRGDRPASWLASGVYQLAEHLCAQASGGASETERLRAEARRQAEARAAS